MRYWIDFEFFDRPNILDIISVGIVAEDGRELYLVNEDANWEVIDADPWLSRNVVPQLMHGTDGSARVPLATMRKKVEEFLFPPPGDAKGTELWGWYCAYDYYALCQLCGGMRNLPMWIPMWINDIRQEVFRRGNPPIPRQSHHAHHALEDARHEQFVHQYLETRGKGLFSEPGKFDLVLP